MKVPTKQVKYKRPPERDNNVSEEDLARWAQKVRYIGSPEHKRAPWKDVKAAARPDAAVCPSGLGHDMPQKMLEAAIVAGNVSVIRDGEWPRYIWYFDHEGQCYTARLTLQRQDEAQYKGWPEEHQQAIPPGVKSCTL